MEIPYASLPGHRPPRSQRIINTRIFTPLPRPLYRSVYVYVYCFYVFYLCYPERSERIFFSLTLVEKCAICSGVFISRYTGTPLERFNAIMSVEKAYCVVNNYSKTKKKKEKENRIHIVVDICCRIQNHKNLSV